MSNTVISVENVSKLYRLGEVNTGTYYGDVQRWWAKLRGLPDPFHKAEDVVRSDSDNETIWALKDVNFSVKQGEVLGIIGRNGSGKSTLLKILSRVTSPTSGEVKIKGRVASLLEVGTGFHPELTGRENIFLNASILGMKRDEILRKFDEIVDFSGVKKFIDTPVKRYSSGMYVRLAFSVAVHLEPDVLMVDEVLSVGDDEFQRKSLEKMSKASEDGRTILFVSHNMVAVTRLCQRCVWIDRGALKLEDNVKKVVTEYLGIDKANTRGMIVWENGIANEGVYEVEIFSVLARNSENEISTKYAVDQPFTVEISYRITQPLLNLRAGILFTTSDGSLVFETYDNDYDASLKIREPGDYVAYCEIPGYLLNSGSYFLSINMGVRHVKNLISLLNVMMLKLENEDSATQFTKRFGVIHPSKFQWRWSKK